MPSNVSPEEVQALLQSSGDSPVEAIALRDFRQPRRLGRAQRDSIRHAVEQRLLDIEAGLRVWLRATYPMTLLDVGETSSIGLFEHLEDPIVVVSLEVGGATGWIVWENQAALAAATVAMGCELPDEPVERSLTPLEAGLVGDILLSMTRQIAEAMKLDIRRGKTSLSLRSFLSQLDPGKTTDPQRLFLYLSLEGPGGPSTVRLYLPGLLPRVEKRTPGPAPKLPVHLDAVPIEVCAELGSFEVSLEDLMRIEVGDVIPIGLSVNEPLEVVIEGRPAGKATWGSCRGHLAIRIERLESERED